MRGKIFLAAIALIAATGNAGANIMSEQATETATFGGGCFWCLEAAFEQLEGVAEVVSGYAGGVSADPDYKSVCAGNTGHAEVVRLRFDPAVIDYAELIEVFFSIHDPTTRNRQGGDVGTQYRSIVLTENEEQARIAATAMKALDESGIWPRPAVTEIETLTRFYLAEDYHQDYYRQNSGEGYCQIVISPKLKKFREKFAELLRQD